MGSRGRRVRGNVMGQLQSTLFMFANHILPFLQTKGERISGIASDTVLCFANTQFVVFLNMENSAVRKSGICVYEHTRILIYERKLTSLAKR